jgi:hypothetical protein
MSGFKVGDEVVIVNRDRGAKVESIHRSEHGDAYYVRFDDGQLLFYREKDIGLKSDFAKEKQLATLQCVREMLLSDEFMTAFANKFDSTPLSPSIHSVTWGTVDLSNADANQGVAKCQIQ